MGNLLNFYSKHIFIIFNILFYKKYIILNLILEIYTRMY